MLGLSAELAEVDPTFAGYDAVGMLEGWHRHVRLALRNVIHAL
jgi:hypothetical protein